MSAPRLASLAVLAADATSSLDRRSYVFCAACPAKIARSRRCWCSRDICCTFSSIWRQSSRFAIPRSSCPYPSACSFLHDAFTTRHTVGTGLPGVGRGPSIGADAGGGTGGGGSRVDGKRRESAGVGLDAGCDEHPGGEM